MKLLLTGSTAIQVGSQRTRLKIITSVEGWKNAFSEMGYDVDWRPVTPGEDLSDYDAIVTVLNKPNSIASQYFYGALWAFSVAKNPLIAIDDWQTYELIGGIRTFAKSYDRSFRLHGGSLPEKVKRRLFETLNELANKPWSAKVLAPILGRGDTKKLGLPTKIVGVDPTAYTRRYECVFNSGREKRWVMATLLDKPIIPGLSWPVDIYGPQNRGHGGIGPRGIEAKPRLTEPELMGVYCKSWGVLSPAHPHAGSSWWRVRYLMASDAGAILSADPEEAKCLGPAYVEASAPENIERLSINGLRDLADRQRNDIRSVIWTKNKVKRVLSELLEGEKSMPKFSQPSSGPEPRRTASEPRGPRTSGLPTETLERAVERCGAPESGEGSGAYMRSLMRRGINNPEIILAAVHEHYPSSKATVSDVHYNRNWLKKKEGFDPNTGPFIAKGVAPATQTATEPRRGRPPKYAAPEVPAPPARSVAAPAKRQEELPFDDGSPTLGLRREIERLGEKRKPNAPIAKVALAALDAIEAAIEEMK